MYVYVHVCVYYIHLSMMFCHRITQDMVRPDAAGNLPLSWNIRVPYRWCHRWPSEIRKVPCVWISVHICARLFLSKTSDKPNILAGKFRSR